MSDLKPCAHCGGAPYIEFNNADWCWVECEECDMRTVEQALNHKQLAIDCWNTRSPTVAMPEDEYITKAQIQKYINNQHTALKSHLNVCEKVDVFFDDVKRL